jgi:5-formyltetrahydrofolate cyclo-ligase
MKKFELRQKLLQNRKPCPEKDFLILKNLLSLKQFREADLVLTYISTEKEIDTRLLLEKCFELKKRVAAPRVEALGIDFYEINSLSDTVKGKFGISEPDNSCRAVQINNGALCVVPALACDRQGFRIGYGKGYYDRFLAEFTGTSAVLCYSENVTEFPVEPHDCAVDLIITEGGIAYGR